VHHNAQMAVRAKVRQKVKIMAVAKKMPSSTAKKGAALAALMAIARARGAGAGAPPAGPSASAMSAGPPGGDMSAGPSGDDGSSAPMGMKKGGKMVKKAAGGLLPNKKSAEGVDTKGKTRALREDMDGGQGVSVGETKGAKRGGTMKKSAKGGTMKKYAKGGSTFSSKSADGVASRGKTKTKTC